MANQDSYEVQVDGVCRALNFMMATSENKLYVIGGYSRWALGDGTGFSASDSQLRVLDFTKSVDINEVPITSVFRLPNNVPRLKWANVFVADEKLRMFGGMHEYHRVLDSNGAVMNQSELRPDLADKMWTFDLETQQWSQEGSGMGDNTISRAGIAYNDKQKVGWVYGGKIQQDVYLNGTTPVQDSIIPTYVKSLYRYDLQKNGPEQIALADNPGSFDQGEMVYIEGAGEAGILVIFGGNDGDQKNLKSLKSVDVYDIATQTWFSQPTSADRGVYPAERQEFCSVVASAEDNTSHNIYIYGGWDTFNPDAAQSNVFVLSLPSFHWVSVGSGVEYSRYNHRCGKVQEKYMVAYRGSVNGGRVCDKNRIPQGISIFDMSRLEWTTKVEVTEDQKYSVPAKLYKIIGGGAAGNANFTSPRDGFADPRLATLFKVNVEVDPDIEVNNNTTTETNTTPTTDVNGPSTTSDTTIDSTKSGPPTGAIIGGVIGGIAGLIILVGLFFWIRRRRGSPYVEPPPAEIMPTEYHTNLQELAPYSLQPQQPQELVGYGPHDLPHANSELYSTPTLPISEYKPPGSDVRYETYYDPRADDPNYSPGQRQS